MISSPARHSAASAQKVAREQLPDAPINRVLAYRMTVREIVEEAVRLDTSFVQARLGHESIQTTVDTYSHLLPDAQRMAQEAAALAFVSRPPELG